MQHNNESYLKVLTVTIIDWDKGAENIENILMMLNKEDSKYQDGYYSDGESNKFLTSWNNIEVKDLRSNISFEQNTSKRKNSLTILSNQRNIKNNLLISKSDEAGSQLSSCVRANQIENIMAIQENSTKLVNKNVRDLDLYLRSNRVNRAESLNSNNKFVHSKRSNILIRK